MLNKCPIFAGELPLKTAKRRVEGGEGGESGRGDLWLDGNPNKKERRYWVASLKEPRQVPVCLQMHVTVAS